MKEINNLTVRYHGRMVGILDYNDLTYSNSIGGHATCVNGNGRIVILFLVKADRPIPASPSQTMPRSVHGGPCTDQDTHPDS